MVNELRKWVFSFDERSAGWFEQMIKVAVVSARMNMKLEPICLYDGSGAPAIIRWLEKQSVTVIRARVPFYDELFSEATLRANEATSFTPQHAAGAYLRLYSGDFIADDYFLYTDCDVMFVRNLDETYRLPEIIAACGEMDSDKLVNPNAKTFNSGVMIINRSGLLTVRDQIVDCARQHHFYHKKHNSYDQTIMNIVLNGKWDPLPPEMNWRPLHGKNDDARIVHFHGPKPHRIAEILAGNSLAEERGVTRDIVLDYQEEYKYFLDEYHRYLKAA